MLRAFLEGGPQGIPDGLTPFFAEAGAAPTAGNAPYPPGTILRFGTAYYFQGGTLAAPSWSLVSAASLAAVLAGLANGAVLKNNAGALAAATAGSDYATDLAASYYRALAISRLALTAGDKTYGFLWDDFDRAQSNMQPLGWQLATTGSASSTTLNTGSKGGVHRIGSGATAGSIEDSWSNEQLVSAIGTQKWWLGVRLTVSSAIDAQTIAAAGLSENNVKTVMVGVFGSSSAVNFRLQYDGNFAGTFADLGVAIDGNPHVFEIYCKGDSKVYYRVDEGAEASVTPAAPSATSQYIISTIRNGTTATNRQLDIDFVGCLYPR